MTSPYGSTVLEHFRRPRNQQPLAGANAAAEGSNPLCGDRVRLELRLEPGRIREAGFTANACAICTASASLLTERVTGMTVGDAASLTDAAVVEWLGGDLPPARVTCATLPVRTLRQALAHATIPA